MGLTADYARYAASHTGVTGLSALEGFAQSYTGQDARKLVLNVRQLERSLGIKIPMPTPKPTESDSKKVANVQQYLSEHPFVKNMIQQFLGAQANLTDMDRDDLRRAVGKAVGEKWMHRDAKNRSWVDEFRNSTIKGRGCMPLGAYCDVNGNCYNNTRIDAKNNVHANFRDRDDDKPDFASNQTRGDGRRFDFGLRRKAAEMFVVIAGLRSRFTLDSIVDSNGQLANLSNASVSWQEPYETVYGGLNCTQTNFSLTFLVTDTQVSMDFRAYIFHEDGNLTFDGIDDYIPVRRGALKYGFTIYNWPFVADTDSLYFNIILKGSGKRLNISTDSDAPKSGALNVGAAQLRAPTWAIVDGVEQDISLGYHLIADDNNETKIGITFAFPNFQDTLVYDPDITITTDMGTTSDSGSSSTGGDNTPGATAAPTTAAPADKGKSAAVATSFNMLLAVFCMILALLV